MCLEKITRTFVAPDMTERDAWKVFDASSDENSVAFLMIPGLTQRGRWVTAIKKSLSSDNGRVWINQIPKDYEWAPVYEAGFHACTSEKDAEIWRNAFRGFNVAYGAIILPVKVRSISVEGIQCGVPVIVAAEMFVPAL